MESQNKEPYYKKIKRGLKANYGGMFTIVAICAFVVFSIWNWKLVSAQLEGAFQVLTPFIIAVFLAYLISPLINLFEKGLGKLFGGRAKKTAWVISIIISYILVVGVIVLTIVYIMPEVFKSLREMDIEKLFYKFKTALNDLLDRLPMMNVEFLNQKINEMQPTFWKYGTERVFPAVFVFSKSVVVSLFNIVLSIVISCYMIIDKKNLTKQIKHLVFAFSKSGKEEKVWETLNECNRIFNGFLIGKTIDSLIIGILCFIFMSVLNLPYTLLISIIVGVTNMIPYFGPFIGAVPGVLIYLLTDVKSAVIFTILIFALQQFDGLYLGPKILGDQTGLKPLWVIFAITVGGAYFGVLGMFLGVPVVAVISYLLSKVIAKRLKEKKIALENNFES